MCWLMSRMSADRNLTRVVIVFIKAIGLKLYMSQKCFRPTSCGRRKMPALNKGGIAVKRTLLDTLICLLVMLLFSAASISVAAPTSSFSGRVIDETGNPIAGVNVVLSSGPDLISEVFPWVVARLEADPDFAEKEMLREYSDDTDAAGLFRITEIGEHLMLTLHLNRFHAESPYNFVGLTINGIVIDIDHQTVGNEGFPLSLVPGASIKDVEITAVRRMSIRGQVLLADGAPLHSTPVSLSVKGQRGETRNQIMLDDEGRFVKYIDNPDTYTVEVIYQGQKAGSVPLNLEKGQHVGGVILRLPDTLSDTVAATVDAAKRSVFEAVAQAIRKYRDEGMWVIHPDTQHAYKRVRCATMADALALAIKQDASLVAINDAGEQHYLLTVFGTKNNYWIGLKAGAPQWDNGDPVTYTNLKGMKMPAQADPVYTVLVGKTRTWELAPKNSPIAERTGFAILEKERFIIKPEMLDNKK